MRTLFALAGALAISSAPSSAQNAASVDQAVTRGPRVSFHQADSTAAGRGLLRTGLQARTNRLLTDPDSTRRSIVGVIVGAVVGGSVGGVAGSQIAHGLCDRATCDTRRGTIVGVIVGTALGAGIGLLLDAALR